MVRNLRRYLAVVFACTVAVGYPLGHSLLVAHANEAGNLDQCANLSTGLGQCTTSTAWVNGNLGASKSQYLEGDSIPYRLRLTGLTTGTHTITIQWDTTKSGKHALDYLTTVNRTVSGADPCAGVLACNSASFSAFAIPADPNVTGAGVTPVAGSFRLYGGGTILGTSGYTLTGTYSGDSSTAITITVSTPLSSADSSVLAWGGHISSRSDWGFTNSAISISGSPYHMRFLDLDGSGGNQDRSLSADAVIFPASITIIKDAVPNDPQVFSYTTTGGLTPSTFTLVDNGTPGTNTQTYSSITTFTTYTVTEAAATGWGLTSLTCTVQTQTGGTSSTSGSTATLNLHEGDVDTCTYTNTRQTGQLTVNKVLSPSNDLGKFNLQIDGATAGTGANVGDGGTTGAQTLPTGNHTVGETAGTATSLTDYTSSISCTNGASASGSGPLTVNVTNGANITCTITNTRNNGTITVNKVLSPSNDPGKFNLQIDGATAGTGGDVGDGGTTGAQTATPGGHTVGETAGTATSLTDYTSSISCSDGTTGSGSGPQSVTVASNENLVCTITNTRNNGTITVNKVLSPSNDPGKFNLQIDGATAGTGGDVGDGGTTGAQTATPGGHTVGETAGTATSLTDYTSSISCSDGTTGGGSGPQSVTVASNENLVCTITNTRKPTGTSQLTVTGTTCDQFINGQAVNVTPIVYTLKSGSINSVSPGVFFYYTEFQSSSAGQFTVDITQANNGPLTKSGSAWPNFAITQGQVVLYDASCAILSNKVFTITITGAIEVTVNASSAGQTFVIGIKYDSTSIKGTTPQTGTAPSVDYTFSTVIGGSTATSSTLTLQKK